MAVLHCRWRRVLCCMCLCFFCVLLALLFVLITVSIAVNKHMTGNVQNIVVSHPVEKPKKPPPSPVKTTGSELPTYFVAPGATKTYPYSATPTVFWDKKYNHAFWNQLQKAVDINFQDTLRTEFSHFEPGPPGAPPFPDSVFKDRSAGQFPLPERLQNYVKSQRQFPVLLQPRGQCGDGDSPDRSPLLLLAIRTSELDYRRRQLVRHSWATAGWVRAQGSTGDERGAFVSRVFLMGTSVSSELRNRTSELLHLENEHYRDILQWDMRDTPLNGTVKQLLFWSWFSDFCPHTSFVFETDDEVFVNTRALVSLLLDQLDSDNLRDFMLGHVVYGGKPDRSSSSLEFIPETFYRGWYPSYARGAGRLSSSLLLRRLNDVSHRVHLFPIEQVYVGLCLLRLNLSPTHHPAFLPSEWTEKQEEESCAVHRAVLLQTHSAAHLLQLWLSLSPQCVNITVEPTPVNRPPVTAREWPHHAL